MSFIEPIVANIGPMKIIFASINPEPYLERYTSWHTHGIYEMHYLQEGSAVIENNKSKLKIEPGDVAIIGPHSLHRVVNTSKQFRLFIASFDIVVNNKAAFNNECLDIYRLLTNKGVTLVRDGEFVAEMFEKIKHELSTQGFGYRNMLEAYAAEMSISLFRGVNNAHSSKEIKLLAESSLPLTSKIVNTQRVAKIEKYLMENYTTAAIEEIADIMHISCQHIRRIIHDTYKTSFVRLLNDYRISAAKLELISSNKKIMDIWQGVGYKTPQYFIRVFKQATGLTPTEYRNTARCKHDNNSEAELATLTQVER